MNILVPIKRVVDYQVRVRVNREQTGVETAHVKMSMNPFDEIALEAALGLKEQGIADSVILVTVDSSVAQDILRHGLAMGADRAILVETLDECEPLHIAKILQKIVEQEQIQLVLLGKQAIDNDCNQVGQMLAGLLNWPQATNASKLQYSDAHFTVVREVDGGLETLRITTPAVITADLRLNKPRFVSLPNIMKAKSKPLQTIQLDTLNLNRQTHVSTLKVESPPRKQAGIKVGSFNELMQKLQEASLL